ncbi:MAG: amidohydrolase family protein [Armatimonadota bacterium]
MLNSDKQRIFDHLYGKIIDCHSHVGMSLKAYSCLEYPYGQTVEELYYKQISAGIDINIIFPASASLYFDPDCFSKGEMKPGRNPLSTAPYAVENEMMMREVFKFNPECKDRFIPFVSVDPGRMVTQQIDVLHELEKDFPIYGIKISAVECQSKITELLGEGEAFLQYAEERDIPFTFHTTVDPDESYSHASMVFKVIEKNPHLRFSLAHCIGFNQGFLHRAADMPNVWVDTAALKIQVQCAYENNRVIASGDDRFVADYSNYINVMCSLVDRYPDTIIWGTDSPWYTFFSRRKQGDNSYIEFNLKGRYEDEVAALNALSEAQRIRIGNTNTLDFLFGKQRI